MKAKGFTLIELLIAMGILIIVTAGILFIYTTTWGYLKASTAYITVSGGGRNTIERIVRPIRQANSINVINDGDRIEIRYDDNDDPTPGVDDDRNIAFYFDNGDGDDASISDNGIYSDSDNNPLTPDRVIVSRVMKIGAEDIFSRDGREVTIKFKVQDDYTNDGYQAQDVKTMVFIRN